MKTKVLIFIILYSTCFLDEAISQLSFNVNIDFDTLSVAKYNRADLESNQIALKTHYGDFNILNAKVLEVIRGKIIYSVELVYSDFPNDQSSVELNKKRLAALFILAPELFNNTMIHWKLIKQTDCNRNNIYNTFHGFVITYRNDDGYTDVKSQKDFLKSIIDGKSFISDSTFLKVMKRNKWQNMSIVNDFTGSMSPYIAQVLLWHSLNAMQKEYSVEGYVFFNDGDATPDIEKVIGKTGGIYKTESSVLDTVFNTAIKTINGGYGGDNPENDIEALLEAQEKFPRATSLILLADNWSDMRDYELLHKIKKPVRVILCGVNYSINIQYINLAYITKGSIHTIEEDILDLYKLVEGDDIEINKTKYKLKDGKFVNSH